MSSNRRLGSVASCHGPTTLHHCCLETLKADHGRFVASGANLKNAKFHNVICPYSFDIPLDQIYLNNNIKASCSFITQAYP